MDEAPAVEIWETTTGGTTWVHVKDPRHPNTWIKKRVGGKGTKRITLTVEEREFNQELVTYESAHHDPFTNGLLVRISPAGVVRGENEVTDAELIAMLEDRDDARFDNLANRVDSEIVLRRLYALAEHHATVARHRSLGEVIERRFSIGKTSQVVKEIYEDDRRYMGADI